jgi:hypothetical protein
VTLNLPQHRPRPRFAERKLARDEDQWLALHHQFNAGDGQHATPADAAVIENTERRVQLTDAAPDIQDVETMMRARARRRLAEDDLPCPLREL